MAFQNTLFNVALDAMAGAITSISLHESDPGSTGAAEVSGGAYARQTPSWGAATAGSVGIDTPAEFDIPGGSTVAYVGLWSDGPQWEGSIILDNSEVYAGDGTFTLTQLSITASNA